MQYSPWEGAVGRCCKKVDNRGQLQTPGFRVIDHYSVDASSGVSARPIQIILIHAVKSVKI